MNSSRKIIALALALLLLIAAGGCGQKTDSNKEVGANKGVSDNKAEPEKKLSGTIKYGVIYAKTGPVAKFSTAYFQAVKFAIDEANKSGILEDAKFELIEMDQSATIETAINATQKLITTDKVSIITGPDVTANQVAVLPIMQKAGILAVAPSADSSISSIGDMIFSGQTLYDELLPSILEQAVKAKNIKTAAIFTQKDNPFAVLCTKIRIDVLSKLGVQVVLNETGLKTDQDFSSVITKINGLKPDVVIGDGSGTWETLFWTQLKKSGYKGMMMSGLAGTGSTPKVNKEAFEGQINGTSYVPGMPGASAELQELEKKYKEATGQTLDLISLDRYEMVMMLATAIKKAGTATDIKAIRDALATVEYQGMMGLKKFDDKRNLMATEPFLVEVKDGALVPLK